MPAALTKDKKRVRGQEIAVHLAWRSTLYITNFPEDADDTFIRTLFGKVSLTAYQNPKNPGLNACAQYGEIFDVRWPSKKFKSTRRFCYVQYTSPVRVVSDASVIISSIICRRLQRTRWNLMVPT